MKEVPQPLTCHAAMNFPLSSKLPWLIKEFQKKGLHISLDGTSSVSWDWYFDMTLTTHDIIWRLQYDSYDSWHLWHLWFSGYIIPQPPAGHKWQCLHSEPFAQPIGFQNLDCLRLRDLSFVFDIFWYCMDQDHDLAIDMQTGGHAQGRHCCDSCNIEPTDGIPSGNTVALSVARRTLPSSVLQVLEICEKKLCEVWKWSVSRQAAAGSTLAEREVDGWTKKESLWQRGKLLFTLDTNIRNWREHERNMKQLAWREPKRNKQVSCKVKISEDSTFPLPTVQSMWCLACFAEWEWWNGWCNWEDPQLYPSFRNVF